MIKIVSKVEYTMPIVPIYHYLSLLIVVYYGINTYYKPYTPTS